MVNLFLVLFRHLLVAYVDTAAHLVIVFMTHPAQVGPGFDTGYLRDDLLPQPSEAAQTNNTLPCKREEEGRERGC